jgi:hypothetical protein
VTNVDPSFTTVEGVPSTAKLVVFPDLPNQALMYQADTLVEVRPFYNIGPGIVRGMIFDDTPAGEYQIFRRASNGGFQEIRDFRWDEHKQWVYSQSELYTFFDPSPSAGSSVTYVGRGVVADVVTPTSPLTNVAAVALANVADITYEGDRFPDDSLFTIEWEAVPGAAGYWLQVYQLRTDIRTFDERVASGAPAPIYPDKSTDYLVAYVPAPFTAYQLGTDGPPGTRVLHRRQTFFNFQYIVRVAAVGSSGALLAYTYGDMAIQRFPENVYFLYPRGGVVVQPVPDLSAFPAPEVPAGELAAEAHDSRLHDSWSLRAARRRP